MSGRLRTLKLGIGVFAAVVALLAAPTVAAAGPLGNLLNTVNDTLNGLVGGGGGGGAGGGGGGGGSSSSPAPTPLPSQTPQPTPQQTDGYTPPAHGDNPHGQGTGAVVDLTPEDTRPLPYDPAGGSEEVVVGSSRGEQNEDGSYHGHVTILSLLGTELITGADTGPGETSTGPAGPLNELLGEVCDNSGICLSVLNVHSETTDSGSTNSFSVASADISLADTDILSAGVIESEGTISESGGCQTSTGRSSVANASVAPLDLATINAADSSSESEACDDGTSSQTQDGGVIATAELVGTPIPVEILPSGCPDGDPNTEATVLPMIPIDLVSLGVCNAEDSSEAGGDQNDAPYGVREALTVLPTVLGEIGLGDLVKVTTSASETHAVAPADDTEEPPGPGPEEPEQPGDDPDGAGQPDDPDGPGGPGGLGGPGAPGDGPTAESGDDELPFTGSDMLLLALIGFGVMGTGLGGMALADRRRRLTQ